MLAIMLSMMLQVAVKPEKETVAVGMFGMALFGVYLVSRDLSLSGHQEQLKFPLLTAAGLVAVIAIVVRTNRPEIQDGGVITNYCASVGFIILVGLLANRKWLWIAAGTLLVAVFFIGALEGVFIVAMLSLVILARRDWDKRTLFPIGMAALVVIVWTAAGKTEVTYSQAVKNVRAIPTVVTGKTDDYNDMSGALDMATTDRWFVARTAISKIQLLGHGYNLTPMAALGVRRAVHNVPLVVVDQIGPLAGLAWLWVSLWCLVKTKWKYIWAAVLIMSVFDHYIWTQFAPWWWALVGVSTTTKIDNDYIFKKTRR